MLTTTIAAEGIRSRLLWIRATIPLICLAILWSDPDRNLFVLGLLLISTFDIAIGLRPQFFLRSILLDFRYMAVRDIVYALAFYVVSIYNHHVPALALAPSVLAEIYIVFGPRIFYRAVLVQLILIAVRMATMFYKFHLQWRPFWAVVIGIASIMTGLLGMEIARLEELRADIILQRQRLKETLTEILATTLSPSGIGVGVLAQENISQMLEEVCHAANHAKGHEVGLILAQLITSKLEAANLLTPRELEMLSLVAEGKSYRQIAQILQVSGGTVRAHVASIMRKADVHSRDEIVRWALKHHLLPEVKDQDSTSQEVEFISLHI